MHLILKRKLAFTATGLAVVAFAGGAYAASNAGSNSRQNFLGDVAKRLHVSPTQLQDALKGAFTDQLAAAVAAGRITQAQANKMKQRLANGKLPLGLGRRLPGGPKHLFFGGPGRRGRFGPGGRVGVAAKYLNEKPAQLLNQLRSGESLAQIASAQGKNVSGLKSALTTAATTRLDKAVAAKLITSAQEQKILSRLSSRLDTIINRKGLPRRAFHPGLRGPGKGFGLVHPSLPVPPGQPARPPSIVY
jgi:AraC-like DNA-binding protein